MAAGATASYASAGDSKGKRIQIPANLANLREPGSTGYVPKTALVTIPAALQNLREPGSTGYVPTHVTIPAWLENFQEPGSTGYVPDDAHRDPGVAQELPASRAPRGSSRRRR